ncbi:cytochrome P450 [Desarmillaria ectypa]|nr:cytochrome P450 [Desarmillaria ectypa]
MVLSYGRVYCIADSSYHEMDSSQLRIPYGVATILSLHQRRNARVRALNEPPMFPYWVPLVGHALSYKWWLKELFNSARILSSDARPVSLTLFGQRVVTASRDISAVFCAKTFPVGPLVLYGLDILFNISKESLDGIARNPDGQNSSLLDSIHSFYYNALKEGSSIILEKQYENRDRLIRAFTRVYQDREMKQQDVIWWVTALERKMVEAGVTCDYDIGAGICGSWYQFNTNLASFWLLLQAVTIPGLADRIRKSIALAFNSRGEVTHLELLVSDPLLRSTLYETLRLFALTVPMRLVMEDTIISGFTFHKGGGVVMCPVRTVHGDTDIWGPDAAEFVPERFIREPVGGLLRGDAKNLRLFGGGRYICPGRFFAMRTLLFKYNIQLVGG